MRLKRLISAFIACAMLVTFMPMQAFAAPKDIFNDTEFHIMQMDEIKEFVRKANDDLSSDAEIEIYGINVYGTTILGEDGSATGGITDNAKWLALGDYGSAANGRDLINPKDYWTVLNDAAILNLDYPITSIEILSKINGTKNTSVAYLDEDSYKVEEIKGKLVTEIYLTNATPEPPKEEHTITYKIVNGTWKNGETVLTETVEDGEYLAKIPDVTSAEPDQGYGPEGGWDTVPSNEKAVTEDATYVYTFAKKQIEDSTDGYFYVLKPESQDPGTTDPQRFYYVGKGKIQKDPMVQTSFEGDGVADQIVKVPSTWPDGVPENIKTATGTDFSDVLWYRVSQDNGANDNNSNPTDDPVPGSELAWHVDGILRPEDGEYTALFLWQDSDDFKFVYRADIPVGTEIGSKVVKDADEAALKVAGKTSDEWNVVWNDSKGTPVDVAKVTGDSGEILVYYADFTEVVQPAMPTVQDALAVYKKTVVAPESAEPFQPTVFKFKLEKQGADEGWKEVESLTGELSTVPVSQSVQNLTIAGTTDVLEAGTYRLSEIQTAEDLMSWEKNDQQFEFTVTDEGEIVRTKEATVFVNTYRAPDLSIEKALTLVNGQSYNDGQSVQSGDVLTYQITVKNDGNQDARGPFNVTDSMWSGNGLLDSVEFTNANGETSNSSVEHYPISGGTVVVQEIPASSQYVFTYHYTVQMADEGKTLSNTVKLTSSDVYIDDSVDVEVEKTHCTITYEYQSGTDGKQLPTDLLPAVPEAQVFHVGDLMNEVPVPGKTTIETEDGTWQFKGWYSEGILLNLPVRIDKDMHIIGLWNFYEYNTHNVKVQYVLEDGTIISEIDLNAAHDASWKVSVSNAENLVDVSNLAVARTVEQNGKHYAFKEFQNEKLNGKVTENITITAVYGLDEIGGGSDQKQPDGVPDGYQATVTYRVVNGTWSDGTELDRTEVFDLYSFDDVAAKWVQIPNVTLGNTIPTGMLADANYVGQRGAWSEDITSETAVKGDATYIYRFGDAAADEIVVYYDDDGSGYGEVTSAPRQVFTEAGWQTIPGSTTRVRIHLTATAEDDGGRTYFDEWQGSLVDNLDRDITENENLDVWVEAEIGQTYTIIANFDRDSGGGAQHPDAGDDDDNDRDDDTEEIIDEEVPLAETPWLNTEDHYAYIIGYSEDGTVRPNANITRAEVATIFFRLLTDEARDQFWMTSNNFSDVLPNDWYNNAVSTMVNMGIIQGYEDGTFRPNANITRAEFAAIAARFMASGYGVEDDLFTDIANHWARESINDAAMAGWINGYEDGTFRPDAAITRAEAVTLVNNVLQRKPDADHMLDSMIKWPDNPEGTWYYEAIQEATNSHDYDLFEDAEYETWTALQENRDWAALEKDWVNTHRTGGEVA